MERTGSIKNKIVSPDLIEERQKCNFNSQELTEFLYNGKENVNKIQDYIETIDKDPILRNSHKFYDMTREE